MLSYCIVLCQSNNLLVVEAQLQGVKRVITRPGEPRMTHLAFLVMEWFLLKRCNDAFGTAQQDQLIKYRLPCDKNKEWSQIVHQSYE